MAAKNVTLEPYTYDSHIFFQPKYSLVDANPPLLCEPAPNSSHMKNAAVAIKRGNCTLLLKGLFAQKVGAKEVIIVSNDTLVSYM